MPKKTYSAEELRERQKASRLRWYYANRERARQSHAKWIADNRDSILKYSREYEIANKEKRQIRRKEIREQNPEPHRQKWRLSYSKHKNRWRPTRKRWAQNNKDKINHHKQNRRGRKNGSVRQHTLEEWRQVLKSHGGKCYWCGSGASKDNPITRDHYVSLKQGGSNGPENLVPACKRCNCRKRHDDPIIFARRMGRLV